MTTIWERYGWNEKWGYERQQRKDPPPPAVGQVWAMPNGMEVMIVGLLGKHPIVPSAQGNDVITDPWPTDEAALVAGPGAPWAPPGWKEGGEG